MGVVSGVAAGRAPSARCSTSVSGWRAPVLGSVGIMASSDVSNGFDAFAGGDDRLDEVPVRVSIPLLNELAYRALAIGGFVVRARKIEGTNGVVVGTNDEDAGESGRGRPGRVLERGGLDGSKHFADPPAQVGGTRPHAVRRRGWRSRTHENHLFDADGGQFVHQSRDQLGTITQ